MNNLLPVVIPYLYAILYHFVFGRIYWKTCNT